MSGAKCYQHRATQGLLIVYWQQQFESISADDLIELLDIAERLPCEGGNYTRNGFYAWLMTRSYVCDDAGGIGLIIYKRWKHHAEFQKKWKEKQNAKLDESAAMSD